MNARRGPWFILTGLVLGLLAGLLYAWVISPVETIDIAPSVLSNTDQDRYRLMIALAYQADANLERARQRLALLGTAGSTQSLGAQVQALPPASTDAKALAGLISGLNPIPAVTPTSGPAVTLAPTRPGSSPAATIDPSLAVRSPTPQPTSTLTLTPSAVFTPQLSFTARATLRPTWTPGSPFSFRAQGEVCGRDQPPGLLQVDVLDAAGQGVPGIKIVVSWAGGEDSFYTGLMPDLGLGHADFSMDSKLVYTVRAGDAGVPVPEVRAPQCKAADGSLFTGGWKIRYGQ